MWKLKGMHPQRVKLYFFNPIEKCNRGYCSQRADTNPRFAWFFSIPAPRRVSCRPGLCPLVSSSLTLRPVIILTRRERLSYPWGWRQVHPPSCFMALIKLYRINARGGNIFISDSNQIFRNKAEKWLYLYCYWCHRSRGPSSQPATIGPRS